MTDADTTAFTIRALAPTTWDAFAALCDRHAGGGFGGCYCTWLTANHVAHTRDESRDWGALSRHLARIAGRRGGAAQLARVAVASVSSSSSRAASRGLSTTRGRRPLNRTRSPR